jgi:integrase
MRQGICELVATFLKLELDTMEGADFHRVYTELLETIPKSQRSKFEAFLLAFHRYLVICGFDHLPRSLSGKKELLPPTAAVVWEHEFDLALTYVDAVAPTPRIALQAKLGLALGYHIPFRTVEIWCIRMGDVQPKNPMFVSVYSRQRDGVGKVKSLRRQEDIVDDNLKRLLLEMVNMRSIEDDASDEDLLFGQPQQPEKRHAQLVTAQLMNDALKWATGDASASFYDLRHSVFSRRARKVLEEAVHGN